MIAAFAASRADLDTASIRSTSDAALALLRPALVARWAWSGTEETKFQNRDSQIGIQFDPSPYGVGQGQPDPMRHLKDPYVPKYSKK